MWCSYDLQFKNVFDNNYKQPWTTVSSIRCGWTIRNVNGLLKPCNDPYEAWGEPQSAQFTHEILKVPALPTLALRIMIPTEISTSLAFTVSILVQSLGWKHCGLYKWLLNTSIFEHLKQQHARKRQGNVYQFQTITCMALGLQPYSFFFNCWFKASYINQCFIHIQ